MVLSACETFVAEIMSFINSMPKAVGRAPWLFEEFVLFFSVGCSDSCLYNPYLNVSYLVGNTRAS